MFFFLLYLIDYVHQEFPIKPAGAGDRRKRESGAWNDWEGWWIVQNEESEVGEMWPTEEMCMLGIHGP